MHWAVTRWCCIISPWSMPAAKTLSVSRRWCAGTVPDHGFVSPGKFIPLAEDTRLIVPIGRWVMRKACEEARNWPDDVKVNVNVSPEQLLEPDFHQEVVEALAASGLRPERLEVEVTESIFLRDASVARNALETGDGAGLFGRARRFRNGLFLARLYPQAAVLDHQGRSHFRAGRSGRAAQRAFAIINAGGRDGQEPQT